MLRQRLVYIVPRSRGLLGERGSNNHQERGTGNTGRGKRAMVVAFADILEHLRAELHRHGAPAYEVELLPETFRDAVFYSSALPQMRLLGTAIASGGCEGLFLKIGDGLSRFGVLVKYDVVTEKYEYAGLLPDVEGILAARGKPSVVKQRLSQRTTPAVETAALEKETMDGERHGVRWRYRGDWRGR